MDKKRIFGYVGSGLLAIGVFMPVLSLPIVGTLTYFKDGSLDGILVLSAGIAGAALTALKIFKWLWVVAVASLAVVANSLANVVTVLNEAKAQLQQSLDGNMFAGLAEGLMDTVQLQFGWAVLFAGVFSLSLASFVTSASTQNPDIRAPL